MDVLRPPVLLALLALGLAGLLAAERRGSLAGMWATKPVASAAFVLLALSEGFPAGGFERALAIALVLSFAGDLLLIPREPRAFRAGIALFLLAHVAFLAAFGVAGLAWGYAAIALVPLVAAALVVARWILGRVGPDLKPAVVAYMAVITAMVAGAVGAVAAGASPLVLAAALAFYANDVLVARDRFVTKTWLNRLAGLPLYYAAMATFAALAARLA